MHLRAFLPWFILKVCTRVRSGNRSFNHLNVRLYFFLIFFGEIFHKISSFFVYFQNNFLNVYKQFLMFLVIFQVSLFILMSLWINITQRIKLIIFYHWDLFLKQTNLEVIFPFIINICCNVLLLQNYHLEKFNFNFYSK